jgi:hypothetical protein
MDARRPPAVRYPAVVTWYTNLPKEWIEPVEVRLYRGRTERHAADNANRGINEAVERGYVVDSFEWAEDPPSVTVTVRFVRDAARAAEPVQPLRR